MVRMVRFVSHTKDLRQYPVGDGNQWTSLSKEVT